MVLAFGVGISKSRWTALANEKVSAQLTGTEFALSLLPDSFISIKTVIFEVF